jgi:hypothetical protein
VPTVGDAAVDPVLAQLVEDAVRILGRSGRDQPRDVIARRLEMIFNEIVERRARRNKLLGQFLRNAELSAGLRAEMQARLLAELRSRAQVRRAS